MISARRLRAWFSCAVFVSFAAGIVTLAPAVASAQQLGQPPALPMAVDLRKVPVGAWAEYSMSVGQLPPMKSRMALVGKTGTTNDLEMIMEGGMFAMAGGKLTMHTVIDADQDKENPVKRVLMQIGDNDPMEMPLDSQKQAQFRKPNPKSYVKDETIKVAAGSFKTKHFRDKLANGDMFDYWVSADVPPFGLVKVDAQQTSPGSPAQGPLKFELTARGKDAKTLVTKPAKPFSQQTMLGQLMGGAQGGGGLKPVDLPPPSAPAKK
jgi:hypothetical protein